MPTTMYRGGNARNYKRNQIKSQGQRKVSFREEIPSFFASFLCLLWATNFSRLIRVEHFHTEYLFFLLLGSWGPEWVWVVGGWIAERTSFLYSSHLNVQYSLRSISSLRFIYHFSVLPKSSFSVAISFARAVVSAESVAATGSGGNFNSVWGHVGEHLVDSIYHTARGRYDSVLCGRKEKNWEHVNRMVYWGVDI